MYDITPEGSGETEAAAPGGEGGTGEAGQQLRAGAADLEQGERARHQVPEAAPGQLPADAPEEPGPGEDPEGADGRAGEPHGAGDGHELQLGFTDVRRRDCHGDLTWSTSTL